MRVLKFIVDELTIKPDPDCDFSGLVPGTNGYLKAEFTFSPEWNGWVKVASFYSVFGEEYPPQLLKDGKTCVIPKEALTKREFKIKVVGKRGEAVIGTNKLAVRQNGG